MPNRPNALPQDDGSGRLMPWLIGIMVYLAALAAGSILTIDSTIQRWNAGLAGTLTVQLPRPPDGSPLPAASVNAAVKLLDSDPNVASATILDDQSMMHLLQPWLSGGVAPSVLPLPVLIDVRVRPDAGVDTHALENNLDKIVSGASIARHGAWLGSIFRAAQTIEFIGFMVLALMAAAVVLTVIFTTRTSLLIHQEVIEILHLIGAKDGYIASRFQWHAFRLGFGGGLVGMLFACFTLAAVALAAGRWSGTQISLSEQWNSDNSRLLGILLLPVLAGTVGVVTARLTVLRALAKSL